MVGESPRLWKNKKSIGSQHHAWATNTLLRNKHTEIVCKIYRHEIKQKA